MHIDCIISNYVGWHELQTMDYEGGQSLQYDKIEDLHAAPLIGDRAQHEINVRAMHVWQKPR